MTEPVPVRHIDDVERRHRLARRHALAPSHRRDDPRAVVDAMGVLHATEASTVYLSVAARTTAVTVGDVDRALYEDRSIVKQLAMRRTMFVLPRDLLPFAWGSASARVALSERKKIAKDLVASGVTADPDAWLAAAADSIREVLVGEALPAQEIRRRCPPEIDVRVDPAPGSKWGGESPILPRLLTWLGAEGAIVRGENDGHWRTSRPRWLPMEAWLGTSPEPMNAESGYAELVRRWLVTFGPGTETDIVWWLGATKTIVRRALAELGAVPVSLDAGTVGWVLPDDLRPVPVPEPWVALLPTLDPTTMGWKERGFYLDPALAPLLFDSVGNAGTTAWVDGRIVGCWVQDDDGRVRPVVTVDLPADARSALDAEAERLTGWLDGVVITNVYKSQQMKQARLP